VGLLDYYRQFEAMPVEEVNERLREEAAERRLKALARVETLDLSQTTWMELPHARIVSAVTYAARRALNRYPHLRGTALRDELASRHETDPARVILGNGAAELLEEAQEPETRVIALANPNDPTGELTPVAELRRLLDGVPDGVAVLLDEALVEFADAQPTNASLSLLEDHPRLLIFRSFSKAWGLAGLRVGYALGGPGSEEVLAELEPDLGVSDASQSGALEALRSCSAFIASRVRALCEERPRLEAALRDRGFEVTPSQANFLWAAHPSLAGGELAARLARAGVLVAEGSPLGEPRHVRIAFRDSATSSRLVEALDKAA
jgi:histidinol-phosphate aminotransferase